MTNTSTHPEKCIGNVTLDIKRLYQSMPKHLQKKVSLHDLKLICDAYNGDQPPVDNQFVADGCEKFGHWPEESVWENHGLSEPANPTCSNTTHKFSHCDCPEPAPDWREFTGTNEMVLKGDQEMHKTGDTEWHEVSFHVGSTARRNPEYRFRTRRPLPKPKLTRASYDEDWNLNKKAK